ncbi:membrane traffic protein [Lithospermum erythrorhizon]|uniref:Membrane traffic protein n=1 Tax=Lithospermum erythrorhizon TaxID=34254 RepID=A0AAV3Q6D9_LITER
MKRETLTEMLQLEAYWKFSLLPLASSNQKNASHTKLSTSTITTLTAVGTMTRLLHEWIAYQRALDVELDSIFSHKSDLDRHLASLKKSSQVLDIVKSDRDFMLNNVRTITSFADHVSAKVCVLDLAQSRVHDTILRLDAIIHRSNCLEGFGWGFCSGGSGSDNEQREELLGYKKQLGGIVRKKVANAVDSRDHVEVVRFIKLYPLMGLDYEGLKEYVKYLKKDIVLAIEENDQMLWGLCGEDVIVYAICELQKECDLRVATIIKK